MTAGAAPSELQRVDARFLLPEYPETACVLHPEWRAGLERAGIRIIDPRDGETPDLVVAPTSERAAALGIGGRMVLLEGRPSVRGGRSRYRTVRHYFPIAARSGATAVVDRIDGRVAERALVLVTHAHDRADAAKRTLARGLVRSRLLPPVFREYVIHSDLAPQPALVREASRRARVAADGHFLLIEHGADHKRPAFFTYGAGRDPTSVAKFSRVAGDARKGRREVRGLEVARSAGQLVAARAPRLLAEFELAGHHAVVQTAATGQALGRWLSQRGSPADKLSRIEPVVDWLRDVAALTAHRRAAVDDGLREAIERGVGGGLDRSRLIEVAGGTPAVFQHGDLSDGNVIVADGSFVAVDWELACREGYPLLDLISLAVCTLPLLESKLYERGTDRDDEHVRSLRELFHGRAPSSSLLLRWLRESADAADIDLRMVPAIVTLWFLRYSELWAGWAPVERFAAEWLGDPELGPAWRWWQTASGCG